MDEGLPSVVGPAISACQNQSCVKVETGAETSFADRSRACLGLAYVNPCSDGSRGAGYTPTFARQVLGVVTEFVFVLESLSPSSFARMEHERSESSNSNESSLFRGPLHSCPREPGAGGSRSDK